MEASRTFDGVAAAYDAQRAGYPDALFEDLRTITGLSPGDRVLELGCGSGQATAGLVARGWDVTAIDPGPAMIERARLNFAGTANLRFAISRFEDWQPEQMHFRLIAAAQSWHWADATTRFGKAATLLAPRGCLAIFGHTPRWSAALVARLEAAHRRHLPEIPWGPAPENWYLPEGPIPGLFAASGVFQPAECRSYGWSRAYTPADFVAYLGTLSRVNTLPAERRMPLLAEIQASLAETGDTVGTDWTATLHVAHVAGR
jgi:trans-aconitate methyltransferase